MFPIMMATGFIELLQRSQLVAVWCILGVSKWRILMYLIIVQMNKGHSPKMSSIVETKLFLGFNN